MVLKIWRSISCLDLPRILQLARQDLLLYLIAATNVRPIQQNKNLRHAERRHREDVAQLVGRRAVNLASDDTGGVSDAQLHAACRGAAVVRCDINIKPGQVESCAVVHRHSAQERAQELDAVAGRADDEHVAHYAR